MANCPNCGRRAMRTKDWVCQWCGYPLLSGGFKQLDKTYKELQEEKDSAWKSVKPEPEPEFNFEHGPEPDIEPEPAAPSTGPSYRLEPEPEPEPEIEEPPEPEPAPEPEKQPEPPPMDQPPPEPGPPPAQEPMITPPPEIAPQPQPEQLPPSESEPEPMITPPPPVAETEPMITPPPQAPTPPDQEYPPEAEVAPEPEQEPVTPPPPEPEPPLRREEPPEPDALPSLDSIKEGTELTIDQIDTLFRVDSVGAHNAFKDKTLLVRGMVNKVFIRDHLDIRYMILNGTGKQMWSARCTFGKESSPQMSRLSEGQPVLIQGKYDGFSKNIIFKDCVLVGH